MTTRQDYIVKLSLVIKGKRLNSYTNDTIEQENLCAQFVRQTQEDVLNLPANGWQVAGLALDVARKSGRTVRWAVDYEKAAIQLGLVKPISEIRVGDVAYWEYIQYGHTAVCVGEINGVIHFLENTNAANRRGGKRVFGVINGKPTHVWLTPITSMGMPRTVTYPNKEIKALDNAPKPVSIETTVKEYTPVSIETIMEEYTGQKLYIIQDNGKESYVGDIVKASELGNGKIFIKTSSPKK